ncbi:SDR family NAD(P)-dependent oxidoreductase [Mycobacterium sp. NPDC006124]|uniref:SDR family NAD(P)-dependent oxidoreductase n=1 Tax=Mycobacterium sp. NPDC006124 TaxID=3156729 RepID=UPI0033AAAA97
MSREITSRAGTVVVVLDGDTHAGNQLACRLLAEGCRVAVIGHHAESLVRVTHGHPAQRVLAIVGDVADHRQWARIVQRVTERFGVMDTIVRAEASTVRAVA